jgi:hypothetical protein
MISLFCIPLMQHNATTQCCKASGGGGSLVAMAAAWRQHDKQ